MRSGRALLSALLLGGGCLYAQNASQPNASAVRPRVAWASIERPPIPADPLEMVTSNAQPVQDAQQRMQVMDLLSHARSLSNLRGMPYDLKVTFNTTGSSATDGAWQLEDVTPSRGVNRWTAQGPGYSSVNLYKQQMVYSNQQSGSAVPLRLMELRSALFPAPPMMGPRASLRTATGELNGTQLSCILVAHSPSAKVSTAGRDWDEAEYCVNSAKGVLTTYSPVPGLYIAYDYTTATQFHGKIIPSKLTVAKSGQTVVETQTISVADPANMDSALFDAGSLTLLGMGAPAALPATAQVIDGPPADGTPATNGIVILHALAGADGRLSETEVLASSNPALNQLAIDRAGKMRRLAGADGPEAGAASQAHEVFCTMQLMVPVDKGTK